MNDEEILYEIIHRNVVSEDQKNKRIEDLRKCNLDLQDSGGYTALMTEIIRRDIEATEFLLMNGSSTEIETEDGETALTFSIAEEWYVLVELVGRYADVNYANKHGDTPMALAKYYEDEKIIEVLRGLGANDTDKLARIEMIEREAFDNGPAYLYPNKASDPK